MVAVVVASWGVELVMSQKTELESYVCRARISTTSLALPVCYRLFFRVTYEIPNKANIELSMNMYVISLRMLLTKHVIHVRARMTTPQKDTRVCHMHVLCAYARGVARAQRGGEGTSALSNRWGPGSPAQLVRRKHECKRVGQISSDERPT